MIGTKDNQLNYKAAEASLRIAEGSRKVAILTRQDSTDMRVIAAATLLFLPGTFVAVSTSLLISRLVIDPTQTLFSASFFSFLPPDQTGVSLMGILLYSGVTALLTTVVYGSWSWISRKRSKETEQLLSQKSHEVAEDKEHSTSADAFGEGKTSSIKLQELREALTKRLRPYTEHVGLEV